MIQLVYLENTSFYLTLNEFHRKDLKVGHNPGVVLKFIILISLLLLSSIVGAAESCSQKKIELVGNFGKHKAPMLKIWSEVSGNLTEIEVVKKQKNSPKVLIVELIFKDSKGAEVDSKKLNLKKNHTEHFDLIKLINKFEVRPELLTVKLYNESGSEVCAHEVSLVQKDQQDGVLQKL